jgi:hypothetical protein
MDFDDLSQVIDATDIDDLFSSAPPRAPIAAPPPKGYPQIAPPRAAAPGAQLSSIGVPLDRYIRGRGTFDVKDELKLIGCRWDGNVKAWYALDDAMAAEARAIVRQGPKRPAPAPGAPPVTAADLTQIYTADLVREILRRGDLTGTIGAPLMVRALRLAGYRVQEEAGDSLADIVAAEAPTFEEFAGELEKLDSFFSGDEPGKW